VYIPLLNSKSISIFPQEYQDKAYRFTGNETACNQGGFPGFRPGSRLFAWLSILPDRIRLLAKRVNWPHSTCKTGFKPEYYGFASQYPEGENLPAGT